MHQYLYQKYFALIVQINTVKHQNIVWQEFEMAIHIFCWQTGYNYQENSQYLINRLRIDNL